MSFDLSLLGVEKNIPKVSFLDYTGIMEAPEKFGKTTFAMLYPNSILLAAEKGYKAKVVNKRDIKSWDDLRDFTDLLEEHREEIGDSVKTIIIDTVDALYPLVAAYICKKKSIDDDARYKEIKDIPFGQGWNYVDEEFKSQIKKIIDLGFAILYLTHSKVKTITPKKGEGEPYDVYTSTMPDRCANIIYADCDYIIHGERRAILNDDGITENKRALIVNGSNSAVSGNRVFFEENIIFDTEEEAFEQFQKLFKESIQSVLNKNGITINIDELEKQQNEEKKEKIIEEINKKKADLPTLITKIKGAIKAKLASGMKPAGVVEILAKFDLKDPNSITDIETAQKVLEAFK